MFKISESPCYADYSTTIDIVVINKTALQNSIIIIELASIKILK